ncbi:hypothetical protein AB5N19_10697 [Seiridium cardinale]
MTFVCPGPAHELVTVMRMDSASSANLADVPGRFALAQRDNNKSADGSAASDMIVIAKGV